MERLDIAIWYEGKSQEPENSSEIDVHLNFWKLPKNPTFDIGIKFPIEASNLYIFFAGVEIDGKYISDITGSLEKGDIRNLVFNEYTGIENCKKEIEGFNVAKTKKSCWCYFTKNDQITVAQDYGGTIVQVQNSPCSRCYTDEECTMRYVRLRICGERIQEFFSQNIDPRSVFQYFISKYEMLDFRLNNVRSLPGDFLSGKNSIFPKNIRNIRCFLICETNEEVLRTSSPYKQLRSLEKDGWKKYIPLDDNIGKLLAYQWNESDKLDFSLFAETRISKFVKIKAYVIVALTFLASIGASCLANIFCQTLGWVCQ